MPRPQRSPVIAVGVLSWLAAVAVAWGVSAGTIPVERWLETQPEPPRAAPARARPPRAPEPMVRPPLVAQAPAPSAAFEPVPIAEAPPEPAPEPTALVAEPPPPAPEPTSHRDLPPVAKNESGLAARGAGTRSGAAAGARSGPPRRSARPRIERRPIVRGGGSGLCRRDPGRR